MGIRWFQREKSSCTSTQMGKLSANKLIISSQTYLCIIPLQLPFLHTVAPTEKGKETDLFKWLYNAQVKALKKKQYTNLIIATNIFCKLKKTSRETICNLLHLKRVSPWTTSWQQRQRKLTSQPRNVQNGKHTIRYMIAQADKGTGTLWTELSDKPAEHDFTDHNLKWLSDGKNNCSISEWKSEKRMLKSGMQYEQLTCRGMHIRTPHLYFFSRGK